MNVKRCGADSLAKAVLSRDSAFFDGDWDGFVATAALVEAGFRGKVLPVSPKESKDLIVDNAVLIELGPRRVGGASKSILIDHHGLKDLVPPGEGYVAEVDSDETRILKIVGKVGSVAEVVSKVLNVRIPDEIIEYTSKVESNPKSLLEDPRYVGYRSLLDDVRWKVLASEGFEGVGKALEIHELVGQEVLNYIRSKGAELVNIIRRSFISDSGEAIDVYFIVCNSWKEVRVGEFRIKPALYLARKLQMEFEDLPSTAYSIIMYLEESGLVSRVSISAGPRAFEPANKLAEILGGGGHAKVAGAPLNLKLNEAIRKLENLLRKAWRGEK